MSATSARPIQLKLTGRIEGADGPPFIATSVMVPSPSDVSERGRSLPAPAAP